MRALAFPLRLQENGLLERQDRINSVLNLIQVMARTPAESWAATPQFGLRDLFEGQEGRADITRLAMQRLNDSFKDLGLAEFSVTAIQREPGQNNGVDQYSITLQSGPDDTTFTTKV